jgi:membrane protein DedA with SNARE-associated domain
LSQLIVAAGLFAHVGAELQHLFSQYGYPVVFAVILAESAGIPVPGETVLLAAGVAAQRGALSLFVIWLLAALAAIVGDNLGYWVGHWGGRPLLRRYGRLLRINERHLQMLDVYYAKHGAKTVFFGRWVLFLRVWAALFAGAARMEWRRFFLYNALGGAAWAVSMSTLAYLFYASVKRIETAFGVGGWVAAIAVAVALLVFGMRDQRRRLRSLAALASEADAAGSLPESSTEG